MLNFVQVNLKKAFIAAVELNKRLEGLEQYIALITESYNFKGKIRSLPRGSRVISCQDCRAAIICSSGINLIKIEKLTRKDCAAVSYTHLTLPTIYSV